MVIRFFSLLVLVILQACSTPNAQKIIDTTIAKHGGELFNHVKINFDFRDKHYRVNRANGLYTYVRSFKDSTGTYRDVLSNDGFVRYKNDSIQNLSNEKIKAFSNSVNSVVYFALLPFGLNDNAVVKEWVGKQEVKGKSYEVIKVSFKQEGGGEDYNDQFLYWINTDTSMVDFLAYTYSTDGGGIRFREAINSRVVEGIIFQDYINYKPSNEKMVKLEDLMSLYNQNKLIELSRIELKNIQVSIE